MTSDVRTYCVIPLSIQHEGQDYIVGNQELGEFYQFPEEGVAVIKLLRSGMSVDAIKEQCAKDFEETIDVDSFIDTLLEIGFISPTGQENSGLEKIKTQPADRRWKFSMNQATARLFFSPPAVLLYFGVVAFALFSVYQDPGLSINFHAFYLEKNLTATLIALLILQSITTVLHEFGHMIAAARRGIDSRLGIGNRLWNIVAEADLSGIYRLPKRERYLPLFAGILVDIFCIACITLLIKYLAETNSAPAVVQILQALILQILVTISWQFNLFLRTDIYYALCNYCNYPNLDSDARTYISDKLNAFSFGLFGKRAAGASYYNKPILRAFTCIWIIGRIAALAFLFGILLPTLARYAMDAYNGMMGIGEARYNKWDVGMFALLSLALTCAGIYMWLFNKIKLFKEMRNAAPEK